MQNIPRSTIYGKSYYKGKVWKSNIVMHALQTHINWPLKKIDLQAPNSCFDARLNFQLTSSRSSRVSVIGKKQLEMHLIHKKSTKELKTFLTEINKK